MPRITGDCERMMTPASSLSRLIAARTWSGLGVGPGLGLDGGAHLLGLQLAHVAQVRHDGDVATAHLLDLTQALVQLVGVVVAREALRPEGEGARSDAQVLDVGEEVRVLEGLEVLLDEARLHEHRVAAREEDVRHLQPQG
eukprot:scaffold109342_cov39-Phaeocystis_antarctica.AAC.1